MTCKIAEYVAEPYVFALKHGARFKWEKDGSKATAYCPYGVEITATASGISYSCDKKCNLSTVEPCDPFNASVDVVEIKGRCRYNKRLRRLARVCPDGLCQHAYNSAYKLALTLLYGGVVKNPIVRCPKGRVGMVVYAKDEALKPLLNLAESVFHAVGCPKDIIDKRVYIKVISSHGCPKNVEEKRVFEFNTRDREIMCPTALHSMLGVLGQTNAFICPADAITYNIDDGRENSQGI